KHALGRGFSVIYPRMPKEADPRFSSWKTKLRQAFEALDDGDILAGHSVGATVLLHALADRPPPFRPAALVLIAPPFIGDGGWPSDDIDAKADFSTLPRDMPVFLYHGGKDETVPVAHMELYAKALPGAV